MKVLLNFLIVILALGVIAKPFPQDCSGLTSSDSVDMEGDSSSIAIDGIDTTGDSADTSDSTDPTGDSSDTSDGTDPTSDSSDTSDGTDPTSDSSDTSDGTDPTSDSSDMSDSTDLTSDPVDASDGVDPTSDSSDMSDGNDPMDSSADPSSDSTGIEARAIIEGLLSPRSLMADLSSEPEGHIIDYSIQPQGTFEVLRKQMTQLSTASSSLGQSVSDLSSNPSFANIYAVTLQLNAFIKAVISSATIIKDLKPMTSSSDAMKVVELVRPIMASLNTTIQGLVQKTDVLTSLGIGCIFEELLAFLLILICFLLELLLFLCKINGSCVKELTRYESDMKMNMKAAIAAFALKSNNLLL